MKEMTEKDAESFLEKEGFDIVKREFVKSKRELNRLEGKISFPWVMKASGEIIHKAKVGAVKLNIKNMNEAGKAFDSLKKIKGFKEAIIQETLNGEEAIIGIKKASEFGHVIMFGKGGGEVEKEKDVSFRVIPLDKKDVAEMIKETKFYAMIKQKNVDMNKLADVIYKIAKLSIKNNKISELDINPLFVDSKSAVVADARILFE